MMPFAQTPGSFPFQEELQRVMAMVLEEKCICSESDRARAAFRCPVHQEEAPL